MPLAALNGPSQQQQQLGGEIEAQWQPLGWQKGRGVGLLGRWIKHGL